MAERFLLCGEKIGMKEGRIPEAMVLLWRLKYSQGNLCDHHRDPTENWQRGEVKMVMILCHKVLQD